MMQVMTPKSGSFYCGIIVIARALNPSFTINTHTHTTTTTTTTREKEEEEKKDDPY